MKRHERWRALWRSPRLAWDVLARGRYDFTYDLMPVSARQMSLAKRLNLFKSGANLLHRNLDPWSWPLHMNLEITNYCNLRCPVCPTGSGKVNRPRAAMDVDLFERLMDEVGPYLLTASLWAWGEPLLHPRLADLLRIIERHDVVPLISTNGQNLCNEAVIDALVSHPPGYLIVAIDGLTDETNSKYRVGAALEPAKEGVRRLSELKRERGLELPVLHMRYLAMKHNEHEIEHVREFARSTGFDLLTIRTLVVVDSPGEEHREFVPDASHLRAYDYVNGERVLRDDFICYWPFWFPTSLVDGTIVGCDQDSNAQRPLGVLSEDVSFADIWSGEEATHVRRQIRDDPDSLSFCRNCPYTHHRAETLAIEAFDLSSGASP